MMFVAMIIFATLYNQLNLENTILWAISEAYKNGKLKNNAICLTYVIIYK